MILLYGRTGTGKTSWFIKQNPKHRILHAENLQELRSSIISIQSPLLEEELPTLINTWFDLDVKSILDLAKLDVTIETHYFETGKGIKIIQKGSQKYYWGVRNEMELRRINPKGVIYFPPIHKDKKQMDMIEIFGPLYLRMKAQFPELLE